MKTSTFALLLPLLANGATVKLAPRQAGTGAISGSLGKSLTRMAPKQKAFKIEQLTPKNPAAKRIRMTWGPLRVKGANSTSKLGNGFSMDGGGTGHNFLTDSDFPTDMVLLDAVVEIQDEKFKRLSLKENFYTHHFLAYDTGKPQKASFACENGRPAKYVPVPSSVIFGGAAEDAEAHYGTPRIPGKKTGYHVKKNSPILMNIDVVNYNKGDMNVYASAEMEYIPGRPAEYLDVYPVFVPVTACDPGSMLPGIVQMPKGQSKWSLQSNGIVAAEDSILFLFRGHMHDGGSNVETKVNGKTVCNSRALYGGDGKVGKTSDGKNWETIGDMVTCPDGVVVKKGDKISLNANYDLIAHPAREGGHSGMLGSSLGKMLGGGDGHAEQMAVMIVFVAPLK